MTSPEPPVGPPEAAALETGLRRWVRLGVVATALIVASVPVYLVRIRLATPRAPAVTPAGFVGRAACAECHAAADSAWRNSDHDRAMAVATEETVRGDFGDVTYADSGITARFFRRDGQFMVRTDGPDGQEQDFAIAYTFGWEPLQQYLIAFPGGRLQALSVAWDTERQRWFFLYPGRRIPPGDWLHWTRNAQNWNGMCAECHSTNLQKGFDAATDTYATTWSEIDVSCEACHGPGSRHVAWAELPPMARPATEHYALEVRTGDTGNREQVALCAPCHSRRTELGDYDHRGRELMDHVIPAVLGADLYHADGQIREEVYVYGSFLQSKMYRNGVRCTDCHDAHSLQLREEGNVLCGQCHRPDTYDSEAHHFHKKIHQGRPSDGALCVKCHMVEQPFMVVDWRADHSFRVPRPDLSQEIGVPNACTQSGCHDDRPLSWSLRAYTEWYGKARKPQYGQIFAAARQDRAGQQEPLVRIADDPLYPEIVRATALSLLAGYPGPAATEAFNRALADPEPLLRYTALSSLSAPSDARYVELVTPLLFDPVKAVRVEAASRLAGLPDGLLQPYQREALSAGLAEYRAAMSYSLDFAFAGHNLGNLASQLGDRAEAERYYRMAIAVDDLFAPAKVNLAILLNASGRNDEAERLLRDVAEAYPDNHDVAYNLGLLLAELGRMDDAVTYLGRASAGMPARGRVAYNYGLALREVGRLADAEVTLRRAVDAEPDNPDFLLGLGDLYLRRGAARRALEIAERLMAVAPGSPVGPQLQAAARRMLGGR